MERAARRDAVVLLIGSGSADFAFRIAQVALPLVVLQQTGSVAATGLAGGAAGVPVLLSPWWARKARQWVDSGARLAIVAAFQAIALALVPAAAAVDLLTPAVLVLAGLVLGIGDALATPGRSALLADTGDRWGTDKAVVLLTWQDGVRRVGMVAGPPLAALAIAAGFTAELLWVEATTVAAAGLLAATVKGHHERTSAEPPSIRASLVGRRDVLYGWIARGTGCFTWFAFTLGLSIIGAERDQPGVYLAAGMTGYGIGSVVGTTLTLPAVRRFRPVTLAGWSWAVMGLCWVGMGAWTNPVAIAFFGAVSGVTVVLGIGAISTLIARSSTGAERRALLSGQSVVVNANAAAGMLVGGPLIAWFGAEEVLVGAGVLTGFVALGVVFLANRGVERSHRDQEKPAAVAGRDCDTAQHVGDRDHDPGRAA